MASNRSGQLDRSCLIVLDESPVRLFLASCSPALLASASPTATILNHNFPLVEEKSANGNRLKTRMSHVRGSVQLSRAKSSISKLRVLRTSDLYFRAVRKASRQTSEQQSSLRTTLKLCKPQIPSKTPTLAAASKVVRGHSHLTRNEAKSRARI